MGANQYTKGPRRTKAFLVKLTDEEYALARLAAAREAQRRGKKRVPIADILRKGIPGLPPTEDVWP